MQSLCLADASRIIEAALAAARKRNHKPMTIVVLDDAGHLKAMQREDGGSMLRFDIAQGKAYAAAGMGVASRALLERAKENPAFFGALSATAQGKFVPQTGAVVIVGGEGQMLGAVGASGGTGDEDEAICIAGVEAAGFTHR
ncbi:heme-binding protein [Caballeronia sp. LP006]|uniref:GlcG/HbpS family heme-binding protein n=1 Tax=Caballeronia sp. LP006 TaxID=3038552 RepID=UPI002855DC8F|nr:heme-binding protein [Caballeronia sp. LP006]MDR5832219.1 heme-binding protein [Caballeronia sp. LP006]